MPFHFSSRSRMNLRGVHRALVAVATRALEISEVDFIVTSGPRSHAEQRKLFAAGKTRTMRSKHIGGRAIDVAALVNGKVSWAHAPYRKIAKAFKQAAEELGTPITWGGDWKSFVDAVHFELKD